MKRSPAHALIVAIRAIATVSGSALAIALCLLAVTLLLAGCGAEGDGRSVARMTLGIPDSFTELQVAATEDARDQWCAANGWCPAIVHGAAGKRIIILDDPAPCEGCAAVGGHTDEDSQTIEAEQWTLDSRPDMFWEIIAHEMGHLQGIRHHGDPDCTMYWFHDEPSYTLECE